MSDPESPVEPPTDYEDLIAKIEALDEDDE